MGKVRMSKYGHAVAIAVCGIFMSTSNSLAVSFVGGIFIGFGLKLAYEAGQESKL